jgi:hypothetical protein
MYLALVGECLEPVLNAVFVAWPLERVECMNDLWYRKLNPSDPHTVYYYLDGKQHCLWGPAEVYNGFCNNRQQGRHMYDGQ